MCPAPSPRAVSRGRWSRPAPALAAPREEGRYPFSVYRVQVGIVADPDPGEYEICVSTGCFVYGSGFYSTFPEPVSIFKIIDVQYCLPSI